MTIAVGGTVPSYVFSVTRDDIIRFAMLNLGKLGEGEVPSAQETSDCAKFLNMMFKQWSGKMDFAPGLKMWKRKRGNLFMRQTTGQYNLGPGGDNWTASFVQTSLTATAATNATSLTVSSITGAFSGNFAVIQLDSGDTFSTTLNATPTGHTFSLAAGLPSQASIGNQVYIYASKATRPLYLESCVLRDINNNDIPMNFMTLQEYEFLPSKTNPQFLSDPQAIYYEAQLSNAVLYTDVAGASDVTKYLHIVYMEPTQDISNPLDIPEYPQEWYLPLALGLSKLIAPMFNAVWTPEMESNLVMSLSIARESNSETTALYFQPKSDHP